MHRRFGVNNDHSLYAYLRGEITDLEFIRRDIDLWRKKKPDVTLTDIGRVLSDVPLMPGAQGTIAQLRAKDIKTAIVSAGVDLLADRIAHELGIDIHMANGMVTDASGRLTGEGILQVRLADKGTSLDAAARKFGIDAKDIASVGNSKYDVSMFRRSALGIAFCPEDDFARKEADAVVDEKDLRGILRFL